ncbi:RNA-binding protein 42 [Dufourea novaeangliae]|uniref:RNA-binding protein 42 n=1 Tax=Dufourea novaeangliae TaxID=178035 RepID=A0A154NYA5_DUFNO|nr:RNA-binding protein 42 [Dufourea novaeangliae]
MKSDSSTDECEEDIVLNDESDDEENYDVECLFCTGVYSSDIHGKQWVQYIKCYQWAHEDYSADASRYVGSRPIKLRKSSWKQRNLESVRKKEKEKQTLIGLLTGR